MKCEFCGVPYKSYYPEFRETEQQCTCVPVKKKLTITCASDLHGSYPKTPGGDLLLIAGDLTARGQVEERVRFFKWAAEQKYRKKVYIAGNHDEFCKFHSKKDRLHPDAAPYFDDIEYLQDSGTEFEGLIIWGSPWVRHFKGMNENCMAFTVDTEEMLHGKWARIPVGVDILITHSPPLQILDASWNENRCGSWTLWNRVKQVKPKLHVFGHIHEGYGKHEEDGTVFVNAAHMNRAYEPTNAPITIIL